MRRQRGLSLIGLIFVGFILVFLALLAMKVLPPVIEYFTVVKHLRALARETQGANLKDIKDGFNKRALIDDIGVVNGNDIEIEQRGDSTILSISYEKKVELFGPVGLYFDFQATSGN
jgi:hypothetical protein